MKREAHALLLSYVTGFVLSVGLTLIAYFSVVEQWLSSGWTVFLLLALAVMQFAVQLFFFLHIGRERKPRWKLWTLFTSLLFVLIVVLGSIWIMYNLNYRMMPGQMEEYLQRQDGGI